MIKQGKEFIVKKICFLILLFIVVASFILTSFAHSGGTDSHGGHYDHKNGGYHFHHGNSAHDHYDIDGDGKDDCPYDFYGKIVARIIIILILTAVFSIGILFMAFDEFDIKNILIVTIPTLIIVSIWIMLVL